MIVSIVIPVFNEKNIILKTLERVQLADITPYEKDVIIVDDGSTDGTSEILAEYGKRFPTVKLIYLPENQGKASAINAALPHVSGDIILIQDADLEYSPDDYKSLLFPFGEKETAVVYGSRFLFKRWPMKMKTANWLANKIFTCLVNLLYDAHITDEGTAYKLFRTDIIKAINIKCRGFEFCPEITAKLLKKGVKIVEVPISYEARDRRGGKKPGVSDGIKVLWTIIKYRLVC